MGWDMIDIFLPSYTLTNARTPTLTTHLVIWMQFVVSPEIWQVYVIIILPSPSPYLYWWSGSPAAPRASSAGPSDRPRWCRSSRPDRENIGLVRACSTFQNTARVRPVLNNSILGIKINFNLRAAVGKIMKISPGLDIKIFYGLKVGR